jgi:hypothetical protein
MGLTPTQVRLNTIKKISRDFALDRHELFRQVHGFDVLHQRVFDQYLTTLDGINKELVVERFQQRDVMTMFQDVDRFGSGEVDLPITNADVHRHLEFLALCLRITNLTTSALWTVDLPSLDISAETENGVVAYRETQAILQSRRHEQEQSLAREAKRRKFIEMEEGDDWDHNLLTWLDELPDDISDEGPTQVRYEPQRRQQAQAMVIQTPDRHDQHRDTNGQDQAFFLESMLNVCTTLEGSVTRLAGLFDGVNEKLDMILSNQATRKQSGKKVIHDDTCNVEAGNSTNSSNLYLSSIEERMRQTISNLSTEIVTISRRHSTTHQAVTDLQNNINVWREGILNELTGIYIESRTPEQIITLICLPLRK